MHCSRCQYLFLLGTHGHYNCLSLCADPPPPPQNLTHTIDSYGISNYSVRIQWEAPSHVEVSNYTIIAKNEIVAKYQTNEHTITLSFLYNYKNEVSISAETCNGISENASISFTEGEVVIILVVFM